MSNEGLGVLLLRGFSYPLYQMVVLNTLSNSTITFELCFEFLFDKHCCLRCCLGRCTMTFRYGDNYVNGGSLLIQIFQI